MEAIGEAIRKRKKSPASRALPATKAANGVAKPVRIVLDLKREADPNIVLNQLYQYTPIAGNLQHHPARPGRWPTAFAQPESNSLRNSCGIACVSSADAPSFFAAGSQNAAPTSSKASLSPWLHSIRSSKFARTSPSRAEGQESAARAW
jgi:hypothetical protein